MGTTNRAAWTTVAALAVLSSLTGTSQPVLDGSDPSLVDDRPIASVASPPSPRPNRLTVCSFNIQFLGQSAKRMNGALTDILKDFDIVVVQELIAPPDDGNYPDGTEYVANPKAKAFFDEMQSHGFQFVLSEENTGPKKNHVSSSSAEWWVAFYKPQRVEIADDLPHGFLSDKLVKNDDFARVPYAFAFRTTNRNADFVLISVHLKPQPSDKEGRKNELDAIWEWISENNDSEGDFIILGDMNIQSRNELEYDLPGDFMSLNARAIPTNTNVNGPKPYDHVMFNPDFSTEVDSQFGFRVVNLVAEMKSYWPSRKKYPGKPYVHNEFRQYFSDHNPVFFQMTIPDEDDD